MENKPPTGREAAWAELLPRLPTAKGLRKGGEGETLTSHTGGSTPGWE